MRPRLLQRGVPRGQLHHHICEEFGKPMVSGGKFHLARSRGYMSQRGETTPGLGTIAVPVFGGGQKVVAALGLAFPAHMVTVGEEPALADALHSSARQLSQRVGGTVYPFGQRASEMPTLKARGAAKPRGRAATTING